MTTGQIHARLRKLCIETDPDDAKHGLPNLTKIDRSPCNPPKQAPPPSPYLGCLPSGLTLPLTASTRSPNPSKRLANSAPSTNSEPTCLWICLCGTETHGIGRKAVVDIRVDLTTLAELQNHPGDLGRLRTRHCRHRPPSRRNTTRSTMGHHRHRRRRPTRPAIDHPTATQPGPTTCRLVSTSHLHVQRVPDARPRLRHRPHPPLR